MKLIIAGKRDLYVSNRFITECYDLHFPQEEYEYYPDEIISGKADGIDTCGENWAKSFVSPIKIKEFPADWDKHGKAAGPIRNKEMAEYGDVLLLIWDGKSKGSKNMKQEMEKLNKPVYEVILRSNDD